MSKVHGDKTVDTDSDTSRDGEKTTMSAKQMSTSGPQSDDVVIINNPTGGSGGSGAG